MVFILGSKRPEAFWDVVNIPVVQDEAGKWRDVRLDVKFPRWTQTQLDEWLQRLQDEDDGRGGRLTPDERVERMMEYLLDWKVVDQDKNAVPFTRESLGILLNDIPSAQPAISSRFIAATYGQREKN